MSDLSSTTRFAFGRNWQSFISGLTEAQVREAERSLADMLQCSTLAGKRFLDIGSGSGLFSLAARRLGATVHSFDFDEDSVTCARELRQRYFAGDADWTIEQGSVLDEAYLRKLGRFDVVYSWGVLHHTGNMWKAMANATIPVAPAGMLFIALYNDQGPISHIWRAVKRLYCSGTPGRWLVSAVLVPYFAARALVAGLLRTGNPLSHFLEYRSRRGMSFYHDWVDWLGGYPFEVASVARVTRFYEESGFALANLVRTRRQGCNQFVFRRRNGLEDVTSPGGSAA